ncbi:MAG: TIGR01777 family oxidoreductase [Gemmatimonadaceae bacterium]
MKIAITGASGFVGTPFVRRLQAAGHAVLRIGRARGASAGGDGPEIVWDAATTLDAASLEGVDAVVHLAGESIAQRWTPDAKRAIRASREQGTGLLARTLASLTHRPRVLVSMSAIGIYGDRGDEAVDESSPVGRGWLTEVARAWEGAADPARAAGIRVVHPRLGVVLSPEGGALAKMLPIFSLGAGGKIGSGRQWMSWISRTDTLRALEFLLTAETLDGAVNLTAPAPVSNADFTSVLGRVLGRPTIAPVPAFAIKLLYGEMGEATVIEGQRVLPTKLLAAGFRFEHPELEAALRAEGVR